MDRARLTRGGAGAPQPHQVWLLGGVYLYPLKLERIRLTATVVAFFAAVNCAKLVQYLFLGALSAQHLMTSHVLLRPAPIGIRLGVWLAGRISDKLFYRFVYVLLTATGLQLVYEGLFR